MTSLKDRQIIWSMSDDDAQTLLNIARIHCKLALEHRSAKTTKARRNEIRDLIDELRRERERMLDKYR